VILLEKNKLDLFAFRKQNVNILMRKVTIKFGGQMKLIGLRMGQSIMVEG